MNIPTREYIDEQRNAGFIFGFLIGVGFSVFMSVFYVLIYLG